MDEEGEREREEEEEVEGLYLFTQSRHHREHVTFAKQEANSVNLRCRTEENRNVCLRHFFLVTEL